MKCKHKNLSHFEVIKAYHGTHYDPENGKVWFNNEYGCKIQDFVTCNNCEKHWIVTNSSPNFIKEFHKKVQFDRDNKM